MCSLGKIFSYISPVNISWYISEHTLIHGPFNLTKKQDRKKINFIFCMLIKSQSLYKYEYFFHLMINSQQLGMGWGTLLFCTYSSFAHREAFKTSENVWASGFITCPSGINWMGSAWEAGGCILSYSAVHFSGSPLLRKPTALRSSALPLIYSGFTGRTLKPIFRT